MKRRPLRYNKKFIKIVIVKIRRVRTPPMKRDSPCSEFVVIFEIDCYRLIFRRIQVTVFHFAFSFDFYWFYGIIFNR